MNKRKRNGVINGFKKIEGREGEFQIITDDILIIIRSHVITIWLLFFIFFLIDSANYIIIMHWINRIIFFFTVRYNRENKKWEGFFLPLH